MERQCNVLPVFGFNSANLDIALINPFFPFLLTKGRRTFCYQQSETVHVVEVR